MNKIKSILKKAPGIKYVWKYFSDYRLKKLDTESVFTNIFINNSWGDENSVSGSGSNFLQTDKIRNEIAKLIKDFNITTVLDIPCGDFLWMNSVDLANVKYTGADIVKTLVQKNIEKYGSADRQFCHLDIIKDKLPKADLMFCRDCLVHFSYDDIRLALKNVCRSESKYLLTTTFTKREINSDIITGRWRALNLYVQPFNLPNPILIINEDCKEGDGEFEDKSLALWKLDDIDKSLADYVYKMNNKKGTK